MFTEPNAPAPLPAPIQKLVSESVTRFTEKLGVFQYTSQAKQWIKDYQDEVTTVARQAFEAGKK